MESFSLKLTSLCVLGGGFPGRVRPLIFSDTFRNIFIPILGEPTAIFFSFCPKFLSFGVRAKVSRGRSELEDKISGDLERDRLSSSSRRKMSLTALTS